MTNDRPPRHRARRREGDANELRSSQGPASPRRPPAAGLRAGLGRHARASVCDGRRRPRGRSDSGGLQDRTGLRFVVQEPQLGTGHALLQTEPLLRDATGTALLLYGDVPLLSAATLDRLVQQHRADGAAATVVTRQRRAAVRLRPHRPDQRPHRADCRGTGRVARRARHQGSERGHLRLRPRAALRRHQEHRPAERRRASITCPT